MRLRIVLISGSIKDETGGVLPGVDVVVRNIETGVTRSVVTDSNGYFARSEERRVGKECRL